VNEKFKISIRMGPKTFDIKIIKINLPEPLALDRIVKMV